MYWCDEKSNRRLNYLKQISHRLCPSGPDYSIKKEESFGESFYLETQGKYYSCPDSNYRKWKKDFIFSEMSCFHIDDYF